MALSSKPRLTWYNGGHFYSVTFNGQNMLVHNETKDDRWGYAFYKNDPDLGAEDTPEAAMVACENAMIAQMKNELRRARLDVVPLYPGR